MFKAAWLALHTLIKAQPGIFIHSVGSGSSRNTWVEVQQQGRWMIRRQINQSGFPEIISLCWAWVYSRCCGRNNSFFLPVAPSSIYTQPTVSFLSQPVLQENSETDQFLTFISGNRKFQSHISEIPVSRETMKSKPSDWHRCAWKKKHSPLFLYVLICHGLLGLQHCLCAYLQSTLDTVGSMQTVSIKTYSAFLLFSSVTLYFLPRKIFSQVPFTGLPWAVDWYKYESSNTAHQPLLGSAAGMQCSKQHYCCSVGNDHNHCTGTQLCFCPTAF